MDSNEYRTRGKEMVDYIADYLDTVSSRRVFPDVQPGFLHALLPESAPLVGEPWPDIMADVERVIMPGVTHWQSPHMHAYFPALNSYPSLLGDMLADAINCLGFTWASSPACTELETVIMNWLGKMIGLPEDFLRLKNDSPGGGVIQTTASESTLICLLAGRSRIIRRLQETNPDLEDAEINARLVAYCSDQAHSSVEKAGLIGLVRMRYIEADDNLSMRGDKLIEAMQRDRAKGLIPFWLCATLGTTGACSFDNVQELGPICKEESLWLHIDAAYAGSAFICPEFRHWMTGIEYADSIAFNPSKWLMVHFDCTALWVKNSKSLHSTFNVNPIYLQHENSGHAIDYMHWQIPLSKRFRALKLWFVIRNYGISGLQKHIREGVRLAQKFEALVLADPRFEIPAARHLGMVVFRLKGANELTERLLKKLNARGRIHCVPACLKSRYVIRFTITSTRTTNNDLLEDWAEIRIVAKDVLMEEFGTEDGNLQPHKKTRVPLKDTRELNAAFGTSLLLANSPMSPKIVDGSFAAIRDYGGLLTKFAETFNSLQIEPKDSPAMRRRIRGMMTAGKQFSLDSCMDMVQGILATAADYQPGSQDLALMKEDDREDQLATSGGSTPGDLSAGSQETVSQDDSQNKKSFDNNQLMVPCSTNRHYRSKSVDTTLPLYQEKGINSEQTSSFKAFDDKKDDDINGSNELKSQEKVDCEVKCIDEDGFPKDDVFKIDIEEEKIDVNEEADVFTPMSEKATSSSASGGYLKKLLQQFSEGSFSCDEDEKSKNKLSQKSSWVKGEKSSPIRKRVDDICKKCLHYKGQVNQNQQ
ncbi:histidine decarboxylase [Arctopsyche grandis]|uniref:histidine decarboxylase n=1 Tax=Arctopsyche grandis TaxID=121162 RepID=UPI00406D669F